MAKKHKSKHNRPAKHKKSTKQHTRKQREYKPNIFDKIYNDYIEKYPFLVFLGLLLGIATFVFWDFLTLEKLYLFKDIGSDSINIFYPQYYMREALANADLSYTFRNGLGAPVGQVDIWQQIVGAIISPHTFLMKGFVGLFTDEVAYYMFFEQFANIIVAAIIFYFFLNLLGLNKVTKIAGSLMFAFSGVMILGSGWFIETKLMYHIAFMLFSFELFLKKKIWYLLPLSVFMASKAMGVFWLYPFGLMLFAWSLVRYFETQDFEIKGFAVYMLKFGGLALIGLALNSTSIYSSIVGLLNNPRVSGDASLAGELAKDTSIFAEAQFYITALLRMFSTDLAGGGWIDKVVVQNQQYLVPHYRGWQNYYEGPMLYISIFALLLIPAYFANSKNTKNKILFGIYMAVFALPVIFPYLLKSFWLFQGTYFRAFSFVIVFPYFYTAIRGLNKIEKKDNVNVIASVIAGVASIILLIYLVLELMDINPDFYNLASEPYSTALRNFAIGMIVIYTALFFVVKSKAKKTALVLFIGMLFIELAYMSDITINDRDITTTDEFNSKAGYNDYTVDALNYLDSLNDVSFYRVEKEYKSGNAVHGSLNDAYIQGYFGTSKYSSSPDARYLKYLQGLGLIKKGDALAARWMSGLRSRPLQLSLINGKYILSKNPNSQYAGFGYKKIHETGDVHIYENAFALPLGFTYDKYILESDFDKLSILQKDIALLRAALVADSLENKLNELQKYELNDTTSGFNLPMYTAFTDSLKDESLQLTKFKEDEFEGKISLSKPQVMYLSILYDKNWIVEIDGDRAETFSTNLAFTGVKLDAGEHQVKAYYKKPEKKALTTVMNIVWILAVIGGIVLFVFQVRRQNK